MADVRPRLTELPADPATALAVHFGMLLGVSDIELLAANPRGKLRLHNAWLHGEGVAWGYRVGFDGDSGELRVSPGFATDANGRELLLTHELCMNLPDWWQERGGGTAEAFEADVVLRHRACLDRPVPAVAGECDDGGESAYSRVVETVEVTLERDAPSARATHPRLRDAGARGGRADLARLAAEDSLDLAPADVEPPGTSQFPEREPDGVVVARVQVAFDGEGRPNVPDGGVDHSVRRVHVPANVLIELVMGRVAGAAGGPRLDTGVEERPDPATVTIPSTVPLHPATLGGVAAHRWDPSAGWVAVGVAASFDDAAGRLVLTLDAAPSPGEVVRIHVPGTGPTPVAGDVGGRPAPLAGTTTDPAIGPGEGRDVVVTIEGS